MEREQEIADNIDELLAVIPTDIRTSLEALPFLSELLEIVLDLGRQPEARFPERFLFLRERPVNESDLDWVATRVGEFGQDNRAGIERTLHRISALRNRSGKIIGLTCRVGRAVYGTIDIIRDIVESGKSLLLLGRPGIGKTTKLREIARVLSDEFGKRVVIVDTSNEIAGDGNIPHVAIGHARRMQVPSPERQHDVMIEAVENHMPEVVVIDEIGRQEEAYAARTIAERGVQLIATAHGTSLENLLMNPTLSDLLGGVQTVTLGDEEARRRGTQKTVLERKSPPTFDVVVELIERDKLAVHQNVGEVVDALLRGFPPEPQIRMRDEDGDLKVIEAERRDVELLQVPSRYLANGEQSKRSLALFPYGLSRSHLQKAIRQLGVSASLARVLEEADAILTLKSHHRGTRPKLQTAIDRGLPVYVVKSNTVTQIEERLRGLFRVSSESLRDRALREADLGIQQAQEERRSVELPPQTSFLRRLQHERVESCLMHSTSIGKEPHRRVVVSPR